MNFDLRVSFVFLSLAHNVVYAYTHVSTISEPHLPENEVRPGCYAKSPLCRMQTCIQTHAWQSRIEIEY